MDRERIKIGMDRERIKIGVNVNKIRRGIREYKNNKVRQSNGTGVTNIIYGF